MVRALSDSGKESNPARTLHEGGEFFYFQIGYWAEIIAAAGPEHDLETLVGQHRIRETVSVRGWPHHHRDTCLRDADRQFSYQRAAKDSAGMQCGSVLRPSN